MISAAFYVSNHGFGHATRVCALAEALGKWGIFCHIITDRPDFLFKTLNPHLHRLHKRRVDFGVIHKDNLQVDMEATKTELLWLLNERNRIVDMEVAFIRTNQVSFIISDASYLAGEIAVYAKIPCYLVSNFDWYYVYSGIFAGDSSMRPVVNTIRGLYQLMDMAVRLPFSTRDSISSCRNVVKAGVLARKPSGMADAFHQFDLPQESKILLVMFGGEGVLDLNYENLCKAFKGIVISTRAGVQAPNHHKADVDADFPALIKMADFILCKPGYSTFAEAVQESKFIIYCKRRDYPEEVALVEGLKHYPHALELPSLKLSTSAWEKLFTAIEPAAKSSKRFANSNNKIAGLIVKSYLQQQYPLAKLLSVFDVGTNNLNYALFDLNNDRVLHKTHLTTGLGKGFAKDMLSRASISRTINVSKPLFDLDACFSSQKVILATGITRMAKNAINLTTALYKASKIKPTTIPHPSEIRYGYHVARIWEASKGTNLAVDIGGATTEFIFFDKGTKYEGFSLDLGLLRLYETCKSINKAVANVRKGLKELPDKSVCRIIGIGLTYYYLALVVYRLHNPLENEVNGLAITRADLQKLLYQVQSGEEAEYLPYLLSPDYEPILKLSVVYSISLLDRFQLTEILVCTDGIAVGYGHWLYRQNSLKNNKKKKDNTEHN